MTCRRMRLPLLLAALLSAAPLPAQIAQLKPLPPLGCAAGQRIAFLAGPIETPYVARITDFHSGNWMTAASIGYAFGGVPGAINAAANPGGRSEDHTAEFKSGVAAALRDVDLQQLLLAAIERHVKARAQCETAFRKASFPLEAQPAAERIVGVGGSLHFRGGRPSLEAYLGASVYSPGADLRQMSQDGEAMMKLSEEMRTMPPRKLLKSGKVTEMQTISRRMLSYMDGAQMFQGDSPSYSTEAWLADGGRQVRGEIEALLDRLAARIATALFP